MKLHFKKHDFQVLAVEDCYAGQALKTNRFTMERSAEYIFTESRKKLMIGKG